MIDRQELIALLDEMDVGRAGMADTMPDTLAFRETLADAIEALDTEDTK